MTEFETVKQYTPDVAAQVVGVTRRTFYSYMRSGRIKAHKVGGRWMIAHDDLVAFLTGKGAEAGQPDTNSKE